MIAFPALTATFLAFATADPVRFSDPPTVSKPRDFVEYWAAARIHLQGGDPYDGGQLLPLQRDAAGSPFKTRATMLWTPPYTLPLYLPFGYFEPRTAHLAWLVLQGLCVAGATLVLLRAYGWPAYPSTFKNAIAVLGSLVGVFLFGPVWTLFYYGQNTGLILLGLAGFLLLRSKGYPFAAGMVGALTAIKPHLLALFGLAVLLDSTSRSGRRVIYGGAVMVLIGSAIALIHNPNVFAEFISAFTRPHSHDTPSVTQWQLPLFSYRLRYWRSPERGWPFWVQFAPIACACLALIGYWWTRRATWDWLVETPRLVLVSLLLAPYGGWIFDLVLLLVPIAHAFVLAIQSQRLIPISLAAGGYILLGISSSQSLYGLLHELIWFTPVVVVWYIGVVALTRPTAA